MPHGQHESRSGEYVQLAEFDLLGLIHVAGRAQHDEQRLPVALQLRPLVSDDGVLHRELVQAKLLGDRE